MFVSIYYKPSLFNAHTMILIVHIFMNVNKLCLNQCKKKEKHFSTPINNPLSQAAGMLAERARPVGQFNRQVSDGRENLDSYLAV